MPILNRARAIPMVRTILAPIEFVLVAFNAGTHP
jgi:hypothetical protein